MERLFERINLPSNGQSYTNSLSDGKINLYPLTAKHEELLCSAGLKRDYYHFDLLLDDIIQNPDVNKEELLQGDIEGILLASKILAYGPKKEVSIQCPHCDNEDTYILNLMDFKPIEANIPNEKVSRHNDYSIKYKNYTYDIFKKSPTKLSFFKNIIESVNDGDVDIERFPDLFLHRDFKKFVNFVESSFPRITNEISLNCSSCYKPITIPLKFDHNFFGMTSAYKLNLHKEIFAIIYNSNGGLTYSDLYNMPVSLRMVYSKELIDVKKRERDDSEQSPNSSPSSIDGPGVNPK